MITEYTLCEWRLIEINERIHAYLLALSSANSSKRDWLLRSNSLIYFAENTCDREPV